MSLTVSPTAPQTIAAMVAAYLTWANDYYRSPITRQPTGEAANLGDALRSLVLVAGPRPPQSLVAEDLCGCQSLLIGDGLSRSTINGRINRIRRFVRWCCQPPRRWLSPSVLADISLVSPIKPGRTAAKEPRPILPAEWPDVKATMDYADFELATLIELHWWTGMRPGEICGMARSMLHAHGDLLIYKPRQHKTAYRGRGREIAIGPHGLAVLAPWLKRIRGHRDKVFRFNVATYQQQVARINRRHGINAWFPNQIRHAYATRLRSVAGIEAARLALGHAHMSTTEIYAERDNTTIFDIIRKYC